MLGLLLVACAPAAPSARSTPVPASTGSPAKTGTGEARHDLGPLAERIPALSDATAATWASGTLGDARVPGPSLYWIDAVVALPPGAAEQLRASLDLEPADARPDVVAALRPVLPDGDLLTGAALDRAFSADGWRATAYLERDGAGLVLLVVGGQ